MREDRIKRIIREHMPVLIALAHSDKGKPQKNCKCFYCAKERKK